MSIRDVHVEVAVMNRIADLMESGLDIPTALRMTAKDLSDYYQSHIYQKVTPFDLTEWVNDGKAGGGHS